MSTERSAKFVVLLVDDEVLVRQFGAQLLARMGYQVFTVPDGPSAVAFCEASDPLPDCILIDFNLPEMNGSDTMGRIRESAPDMPAILCSGYSPEALGIADEDTTWNGVVTKPFRREALAIALERVQGQRT